jgi:hypothetical protein
MTTAISMARELGITKIAVPSAGNAASAAAAYCAAAGIKAHIFMPMDVPQANFIECKALGAHVTLVNGLISWRRSKASSPLPKEPLVSPRCENCSRAVSLNLTSGQSSTTPARA